MRFLHTGRGRDPWCMRIPPTLCMLVSTLHRMMDNPLYLAGGYCFSTPDIPQTRIRVLDTLKAGN